MTELGRLKGECIAQIHEAWDFAKARYNLDHLWGTSIQFSNALVTTAGKCYLATSPAGLRHSPRIVLSVEILLNEKQAFVIRTPKHEAAHAIAWAVGGDRGHGPAWHRIARELGIEDTRCHSFAVRRRQVTRIEVWCACDKPHQLTPQRVHKIRSGQCKTWCKACKQFLDPR